MLAQAGVLAEAGADFAVRIGPGDQLPDELPPDPVGFADTMAQRYQHGQIEVGLFRRSGAALGDVLQGGADPLTLLFSSGEPTAADLYLKAPVARAANRMLSEAVRALVVYNLMGQQIRVLADSWLAAGAHRVRWNGRTDMGAEAASGVYWVVLQVSDAVQTAKLALIR